MKLFSKDEVNTSRQFEFDLAKAVCILGMVFVHSFEEFPLQEAAYGGSLYYILVSVLDALFGAGTFMICLGIGLNYTKKNTPDDFIKRGLKTLLFAYILNFIRFALPSCAYFLTGFYMELVEYVIDCLLYTDIMQFAGLAFLLFGLLKKLKLNDIWIAVIALIMSITGSFIRLIDFGSGTVNTIIGLFVGSIDLDNEFYPYYAPFPILNWFIIVIFGYFFGKLIKRCENTDKFYTISTPITGVIVATYMAIAIPNRLGMMCGDEKYYFQMTTLGALMIMCSAVFIFGVYHFISKLFSLKFKNFVTGLSVNINKTYCIHWIIIGWIGTFAWYLMEDGIPTYIVLIMALVIYIISTWLAEVVRRKQEKKRISKNVPEVEY